MKNKGRECTSSKPGDGMLTLLVLQQMQGLSTCFSCHNGWWRLCMAPKAGWSCVLACCFCFERACA